MELTKTKSPQHSKGNNQQNEKETCKNGEKIAKHISNKGVIYVELYKTQQQKKNLI